MKTSKMNEGYFRKDRENEQLFVHFYDEETERVAFFNKDTGKFISFWKMNEKQVDKFTKENNII
jgi:hypothetical protein